MRHHGIELDLPERPAKPRRTGLTMMIDNGLPTGHFTDVVKSFAPMVDIVKFGWGTSLVTEGLVRKLHVLREAGVDFYFGGTLFEKFLHQGRLDDWQRWVDRFGCTTVEISNGTIDLPNERKAEYVERFAREYQVFSEVGAKDQARSEDQAAQEWIDWITQDQQAGASYVITESRESGKSGICGRDGQVRGDLFDQLTHAPIDMARMLFEAPNKELQAFFIRRLGPDVNLGNIASCDLVGLETLRLGLRSDTFFDVGGPGAWPDVLDLPSDAPTTEEARARARVA
ncbi:phosphosulfolactate synthase [Jatrophihabitans sp. YIM 134969]